MNEINGMLQQGGLTAVLALSLFSLAYLVKRFMDFLEKTLDQDRQEREAWRRILEEHTLISKQMYLSIEGLKNEVESLGRSRL